MYDLQYVRKRRRRRIAALVSLIAAIGVTSLVITSFLGRTTGTFTVKVINSDVNLSLSKTEDFAESSSYLHIDKLLPLRETTYENLPAADILDSEDRNDNVGAATYDENKNPTSLYFVKYTFYVKNTGYTIASYNFSVLLNDRTKSIDGTERTLDDTLRVMVYDSNLTAGEAHGEPRIFAKEAATYHIDKSGTKTTREFVSRRPYDLTTEDDEHPLAESFKNGQTVVSYQVGNFQRGDLRRYTIVIWLEGFDEQSRSDESTPDEASLKIGVDIDAFKN